MTEQPNFRTAFNGFNREDVVQYIEEVNAKHEAEVSQLNSDIQYLQDKLTQYENLAEEGGDEAAPELEQRVEDQANALVEQSDRIAELERQLAEAQEAAQAAEALLEETEAQLQAALAHNQEVQIQQDAELAAYRRAELVERQAKGRAQQINNQVNGALTDAAAKVDEAAAQIAAMTEVAMQQLKQLQLAVTGSKQVLEDTAAAMAAVCPAEEEE